MSGFVSLHRRALDHPLLDNAGRLGAWSWLLLRAAWKDTPFRAGGEVFTLKRGQLCVSIRQLAEAWGWPKSTVDRFLTRLENGTMVERETGHGRLVLTICNYEKYQQIKEGQRDSSGTLNETAAGQQRDTKEQGNKIIPFSNENGGDFSDQQFWSNARAYLGSSKGGLIGKWCRDFGQPETARAITEAQLNRAADPVPYIERTLRRGKASGLEMPVC